MEQFGVGFEDLHSWVWCSLRMLECQTGQKAGKIFGAGEDGATMHKAFLDAPAAHYSEVRISSTSLRRVCRLPVQEISPRRVSTSAQQRAIRPEWSAIDKFLAEIGWRVLFAN